MPEPAYVTGEWEEKNPSGLEIQKPARPVGRGKAGGRAGEAKPSNQITMFGDKFLRK